MRARHIGLWMPCGRFPCCWCLALCLLGFWFSAWCVVLGWPGRSELALFFSSHKRHSPTTQTIDDNQYTQTAALSVIMRTTPLTPRTLHSTQWYSRTVRLGAQGELNARCDSADPARDVDSPTSKPLPRLTDASATVRFILCSQLLHTPPVPAAPVNCPRRRIYMPAPSYARAVGSTCAQLST